MEASGGGDLTGVLGFDPSNFPRPLQHPITPVWRGQEIRFIPYVFEKRHVPPVMSDSGGVHAEGF